MVTRVICAGTEDEPTGNVPLAPASIKPGDQLHHDGEWYFVLRVVHGFAVGSAFERTIELDKLSLPSWMTKEHQPDGWYPQ